MWGKSHHISHRGQAVSQWNCWEDTGKEMVLNGWSCITSACPRPTSNKHICIWAPRSWPLYASDISMAIKPVTNKRFLNHGIQRTDRSVWCATSTYHGHWVYPTKGSCTQTGSARHEEICELDRRDGLWPSWTTGIQHGKLLLTPNGKLQIW